MPAPRQFQHNAGPIVPAAAFALLMLAACGEPPAPPQEPEPAPAAETSPPPAGPAPGGTMGGDGPQIELIALTERDLAGKLPQELACSFSYDDSGAILIAKGNVDKTERSQAVISNGGVVEDLQSTTTGGYDGMVEGVTFGGKGMTIAIAKLDRQETGNEQVAHTATLTARRADGAERVYPGTWTCGP